MSKVLVLGKSGQLGRALQRMPEYADARFMDRRDADLSQPEELASRLASVEFDVLINAAAYTAVDRAEEEEDLARRVNADAPGVLADICAERDAVLIHVSTDYVFGPTPPIPIDENHPTEPVNAYGRTKLQGEIAVRERCPRHLILRTAWLYGAEGHNFVRTMLGLARRGKSIKVVYDQVGAPTFVDDLAAALPVVTSRCAADSGLYGTYHFANEGVCSWYDVAHAIFEIVGAEVDLSPVRSEEFPTPAERPAYSVLDKTEIKHSFALEIRHWRQALRACLDRIKTMEKE